MVATENALHGKVTLTITSKTGEVFVHATVRAAEVATIVERTLARMN